MDSRDARRSAAAIALGLGLAVAASPGAARADDTAPEPPQGPETAPAQTAQPGRKAPAQTAQPGRTAPARARTAVRTTESLVSPAPRTPRTPPAPNRLAGVPTPAAAQQAATGGSPSDPVEGIARVLSDLSRQLTRLFVNRTPIAMPVLDLQTQPRTLTGTVGGVDPDGDPLAYRVVTAPARGTVVIDDAGGFTYTADEQLAAAGGTDTFVVSVRDTGFHLNFWTPTEAAVPIAVTVAATGRAGAAAATPPGDAGLDYRVTDDWGTGHVAAVTVRAGRSNLSGWTVEFDSPAAITNIWNAQITSRAANPTGYHYVIRNAAWNGQVAAGQSTSFGYQATPGAIASAPTGLRLNGTPAAVPAVPSLTIADATVTEGNSGSTPALFAVTLSGPSPTPVSVRFATADGTAAAGTDYTANSGTLTFAPGVTSQTVTVGVRGDTATEPTETFAVTLSGPTGATIARASAIGTITNDDTAAGTPAGTVYKVTADGPDIAGFNPARDKLDLGDVSVHSFIVVDTPEGVGFRNPWTGDTAIVAGVSLGQLTVDSFAPVINDHLRQDLSGALAWEQGVTAAPSTVYARSHEAGQVDKVAFNPATDVVDFRYFGTREQIYLNDSPDGVVISNAGTGQALILQGVTKAQLGVRNFVFHFAQVREDRVHTQLGLGAIPDAQIRPQGVPVAGTGRWPTAAGKGAPPAGASGTTTVIAWRYGTDTAVAFNPARDRLDFGWFTAPEFDVTEQGGSTRISIVGNRQTYTLSGVPLGLLTTANIIALDSGARTKWQNLIYTAARQPTQPLPPSLSVADRRVTEGNSGTAPAAFTVTLSKPATTTVTVGYSTANGSATAAGGDYTPAAGTLTFAPGETAKTVSVAINGDTLVELDEQFTLTLSNPAGATIATPSATGTIVNDDTDPAPATPPAVRIGDLSVAEGNGEHAHLMFDVTLDKASTSAVTVGYATADGTARAGADYQASAGTVTFSPGVTAQQIHVGIIGDTLTEPNETFAVTLANPVGLTIADGSAIGTILDDDTAGAPTPGLSVSDASATEPGARGMAPGFLRTSGNQIVDSQGRPVQLSGVNWFGMESTTLAPHGLWTRGYRAMIDQMAANGFNTIRLPFASELLHTTAAPNGIDFSKNSDLQGLSGLQVMDRIVDYAGQKGIRVILDHHRGAAGAGTSDNGLWYDSRYTEDAWVADWQTLAARYRNNPTVIGFDLHNEPYNGTWGGGGATDWARAAERAGNAALAVNPNLLIFVEGVGTHQGQSYWWGGNLMGVQTRPITLSVPNRVVYSPHDYPNSVYPQPWFQTADFGAGLPARFRQMWGYIYEQNIAPVYLGEFGTRLTDPKDAVWLEAITSYLSGDFDNNGTIDIPAGTEDLSWTFWSWNPNSGDTGGILADDWVSVNQNKMAYLTPIQFGVSPAAVATFTVTLTAASAGLVTVGYATSNATAAAGSDYVATVGTLTFAPGETSKTVTVPVLADALTEPDETFTLTLSGPAGATVVDGSGLATIVSPVRA